MSQLFSVQDKLRNNGTPERGVLDVLDVPDVLGVLGVSFPETG